MDGLARAAAWYAPACRTWTSTSRATRSNIAMMRTKRTSRTRRVKVPFSQPRRWRESGSRATLAGGRWGRCRGRAAGAERRRRRAARCGGRPAGGLGRAARPVGRGRGAAVDVARAAAAGLGGALTS